MNKKVENLQAKIGDIKKQIIELKKKEKEDKKFKSVYEQGSKDLFDYWLSKQNKEQLISFKNKFEAEKQTSDFKMKKQTSDRISAILDILIKNK